MGVSEGLWPMERMVESFWEVERDGQVSEKKDQQRQEIAHPVDTDFIIEYFLGNLGSPI